MIKPFKEVSARELVEEFFVGGASIKHDFGDYVSKDIYVALEEILEEYDEMKKEMAVVYEMQRHIEKLEAMLDRRKARYKKWEDVII